MVDLADHEKKINELEVFFSEIVSNLNNLNTASSGAGAEYGLECALIMKRAVQAYKKKPENKHLKSIFLGYTAISRGVESFVDYNLEMRFREVSEGNYFLQKELESNIKW